MLFVWTKLICSVWSIFKSVHLFNPSNIFSAVWSYILAPALECVIMHVCVHVQSKQYMLLNVGMWICLCLSEPFFILDFFGSGRSTPECCSSVASLKLSAQSPLLLPTRDPSVTYWSVWAHVSTHTHTRMHAHTHTESHSSMAVSSHLLIKWKQSGDGWFGGHLDNSQSSRSSHRIPNRLVEGEREKRGEDKWDEHSSRWTKAPLHAESQRLYCCEWAGRGGDLPREDRGVQVAPES